MEKKFYYIDAAGKQYGPFAAAELANLGVTPTTYVWCAGMANWAFAKDVPEVASYLNAPQAPVNPQPAPQYAPGQTYSDPSAYEQMPTTYLGWAIAATLLCCLPLGVVSIVYATQVSSKWNMGDKEGARNSSKQARTWLLASVISAAVFYFLYILAIAIFGIGILNL